MKLSKHLERLATPMVYLSHEAVRHAHPSERFRPGVTLGRTNRETIGPTCRVILLDRRRDAGNPERHGPAICGRICLLEDYS